MKQLTLALMLVLFAVGSALAQRTISGTISDPSGEALIGASVLVKGTSKGAVTDIDGKYSIEVPEGSTTLVVSYTGYSTQELEIGASNILDITLSEAAAILDEIVVTAVGLEANRANLGYSIQNVDPDEVLASREVNLVDALNSKVAGVQVTSSSGSPGASSSIRIRGSVSVNKSNQPLFVVDGVPIDNTEFGNGTGTAGVDNSNRVIDINPNDIASMSVLKGPSATALYGVRAANGAIIITTKKGAAGKPKINISASYSADRVNKFNELQSTYAQGRVLSGTPTYLGPETGNGFSWGPLISDLEYDGNSEYFFNQNGNLVPKGQGNGRAAEAFDQQDFFVTGETYDINANVSGGNNFMTYYISGGRLSATGIVPNADFTRTTFRVNTDAKLTDKLSAGISVNFVNSGGTRIQRGSNLNGVMLGLLRTAPTFDSGNGKIGQAAADDPSAYVNPDGSQRSYRWGIYDNPYWTVNKNPSEDNVNRVIGNVNVKYDINNWLFASYRLGVDTYSDRRLGAFDINLGGFGSNSGSVENRNIEVTDINSDLILGYNKPLTETLSLSGVLGYNVYNTKTYDRRLTGTTLAAPNFYHISNATDLNAVEDIFRKRIHGFYATADVNYSEYLFLNLAFRNDWSSSLPTDNNTYQSYSASLGLELIEALNVEPNPIISYAKIRASYGVVGNDAPLYATTNVFDQAINDGDGFITGITFPAFGTNAFERSTQLGNNEIVPEKSTTYEVGGEFKFLRGKVGLDVTYYDTRSEDIILAVQVSSTSGFTSLVQNSGVITNTGWEIVGDIRPIETKDFSWDITANFNTFTNTVEELAEGIDDVFLAGFVSTSVDLIPGQPYSVIFGNGWQRTDDGDVIVGADGWPLQDPTKKVLGDPNPDWTLGLRNTFTYKGIRLSALLDIRQGGDMWCGTCGIINYFGTSKLSADERDDIVVFEGVQEQADGTYVPNNTPVALGQADPTASFTSFYRVRYGFGGISEMNIFDTSWLRLRDVSIGYSLPKSVLENLPFEGLNVTLTGRNLWLKTDYPGIDPETNLTGVSNGYGLDYFNMPNTKSYNVTVNLTF